MKKYTLNETPVKTTNGFKINNISVDLDIPVVYKLNIINITCDEMDKLDISIDKAKSQSEEYGHSLKRELCFLAVHGMLHLLGYDHREVEDEKVMFAKQEEVLSRYGIER